MVEAPMMVFALRSFSLAFLAWHLGLLFPGLADPAFLAAAAVLGLAGGAWVRRWRLPLAAAAGVGAFALGPVLLALVPTWITGGAPSALDTLPLWADRQLTFALLPFALAWTEGWAFTGRTERRGVERLVHAAAVVVLFWSQGPYHVTLYPHPLALALAFGLFLISELVLLAGPRPRVASWAVALLVAVLGAGLLWSLLGRYEDQSTASGGGLLKPDLFQFDFAPLVRLEDEITLGENLVLLYREDGTPRNRYLRRLVLDAYDPARGFSLTEGKGPTVGRKSRTLPPSGGTQERVPVRQEYYLVNLDPSSLLALNDPVAVTPFAQWNQSSFVNAYRVDSLVSGDALWLYNEQYDDGLTAEQRSFYTRGGDDPELRALAVAWTKGAASPYEKASAILQNLKDHYFYSLKPGAPGPRGALKHFLFEGKKGYCSYFAFSMTLLLRSLGVPARIAVGFATNPADAVMGFTPVRAFQAHAWVEVPFGPYGWLEFDPTSDTPAPGEPFQFPSGADSQELSKMIAEILDARPQPLVEAAEAPRSADRLSWEAVWNAGSSSLPWLLPLLLLAANEGYRQRWRWARWRARQTRSVAAVWWAELAWRARRARRGPVPGETPEAWAARWSSFDPALQALAADFSQARYAAVPEPHLDRRIAARARPIGRRFDHARSRLHRVAGLLFPWWPR
jgi:transglutaminase-like putative cysteine protease